MSQDRGHPLDGVSYSRRRAIQATLAGVGITLAGCVSDEDSTDTDPEGDGDGSGSEFPEDSDTPLRHAYTRTRISEANLNPHAANFDGELSWPINTRMGGRSELGGEWYHHDIEWWELKEDDNELHIKLKDDLYWSQNGEVIDEVTAEDWVMNEEMGSILMVPNGEEEIQTQMVTGWHAAGPNNKILVEELNDDGYNDALLTSNFYRRRITHYRDGWLRPYYEQLQDASTEDARDEIRTEVIEETKYLTDDEPPALSGPYMLESTTPQVTEFRRKPDHWSADEVNWDRFQLVHLSAEGDQDYQAAQEDDVDMGFEVPQVVRAEDIPDHLKEIHDPTGVTHATVICLSYSDETPEVLQADDGVAGQQTALVRQAIADVLDFESITMNEIGERAGENVEPTQKPLPGSHQAIQEDFPDLWDAIPSVAEPHPDRAEEKLERAGLEKDGDEWITPDGEPLRIEFGSFSWSRNVMDTAAGQLQEFGIRAEHLSRENSVGFSVFDDGQFQAQQGWVGVVGAHSDRSALLVDGPDNWQEIQAPEEFEVPPIGEYDAEPTETINAPELASGFATAPQEEHLEEIRKLYWATAYHVPVIPIFPSSNVVCINTNHFQWPQPVPEGTVATVTEDDHPVWSVPAPWRDLRRGMPGHMARE